MYLFTLFLYPFPLFAFLSCFLFRSSVRLLYWFLEFALSAMQEEEGGEEAKKKGSLRQGILVRQASLNNFIHQREIIRTSGDQVPPPQDVQQRLAELKYYFFVLPSSLQIFS